MREFLKETTPVNILTVNFDFDTNTVFQKLFSSTPYVVQASTNDENLLREIQQCHPDLILLKHDIAGIDRAFEHIRAIKNHLASRDIPVAVIGTPNDDTDRIRSYEAGAVDYIVEPFLENELRIRVINHISNARDRNSLKALTKELEQRVSERTAELVENEERLAFVLEGSQQGFWDWNIQTGEVKRNENWAKMLGYKSILEFENNTKTWTDKIHPDDRETAWAAITDHLNGRSSHYRVEYRMLTKNGEIKWILDQAKIVKRDSDGKPLRMSGTHTDITERKLTENKIRHQSNILEMIYKHTHDCIVLLDKHFNFIQVNEAYAKACARDVSEFPGHNHFEFYPSILIYTFENVVKSKAPFHILARPFDFPDHPEWGTTYWDLSLIPILDRSGEVEFLLFTLKDVTSRVLAEHEKEQLQTQLQQAQKMETIGQLTGGIAHDFNNILGAILGFAELSEHRLSFIQDNQLEQYNKQILTAAEKGRDLVSSMLAFGRNNTGGLRAIDGATQLNEVATLMRSTIPKSVSINLDIAPNVPPLLTNAVQLHQVLTNLIINGYHASGEHGKLTLSIGGPIEVQGVCASCHQSFSGKYNEIDVCDNGVGISEENIKHIFEPFFTTKPTGKGSGMGLPMVHGIVHSCGGHILVESEKNTGSTFRLLFNVAQSEIEPDILDKATPSKMNARKNRILVVDDETSVMVFVQELLKFAGYNVEAFSNPLTALDRFTSSPHSFDLLITDQTMPGITGVDLVQHILSLRPELPVVLCTGFSERVTEETAHQFGITKFLKKPVPSTLLLKTIAELLNKSNDVSTQQKLVLSDQ
ncbi:MAG: response regulator [Gammaproteobacteria bacterium]|nr:response regulator [Gammaproteobacteria bacterium]